MSAVATAPVDTLDVGGIPGEAINAVFGEFLVFAAPLGVADRVTLATNQGAYYGIPFSD